MSIRKKFLIFLFSLALFVLVDVSLSKYNLVQEAKESVRASLKDPQSAQFQNIHVGLLKTVCGEVNSRNGFGGYVGFRKFIKSGLTGHLEFEKSLSIDPEDKVFKISWDSSCK